MRDEKVLAFEHGFNQVVVGFAAVLAEVDGGVRDFEQDLVLTQGQPNGRALSHTAQAVGLVHRDVSGEPTTRAVVPSQ